MRRYSRHGMTGTKIHEVWKEMKRRCKGNYYSTRRYAEKGIAVCDEWQNSGPFIEWALSNGYQEGLILDRIDNSKGYSPENCRWVTPKESAENRDTTLLIEYAGQKFTIDGLAAMVGCHRRAIYTRYRRGWPIERIINQPVQKRQK